METTYGTETTRQQQVTFAETLDLMTTMLADLAEATEKLKQMTKTKTGESA